MADEDSVHLSPQAQQASPATFQTLSRIIELLDPLSPDDRRHVLQIVSTWFRLSSGSPSPAPQGISSTSLPPPTSQEDEKFSNRSVQSAKEFIFEKAPTTESERVACLAYYLTHFLDTPHFRNIEVSNLNTDAAQRKLTNPGVAVSNAMRDGFLVPAPKAGHKQLSAMGERFVQLLPDRTAALEVRQRMAARRSKRKSSGDEAADTEQT